MIDLDDVARDIAVPSDDKLAAVGELCKRQIELEREVEDLESILKNRKADLRRVSDELLPEAMLAAGGLLELRLESGEKIAVTPLYGGSISEANRNAAHDWLRSNGHDDLIKHEIAVSLGKGEDADARAVTAALQGLGVPFRDQERVHPQTLKAFVREQTEAGVDLPDVLGAFVGQRTKITR